MWCYLSLEHLAAQRADELRAEAEQHRLVAQARAVDPSRPSTVRRALRWRPDVRRAAVVELGRPCGARPASV